MAKRKLTAQSKRPPPEMIGRLGLSFLLDVMADRSLSDPLTKTAVIVARHMREGGEEAGLSYPSHQTVHEATGAPLRTIRFHFATLVARGYLKVAERGNAKEVRYRYIAPSERQLAANGGPDGERQLAASHNDEVSGNTQPVTRPERVAASCQSERQQAAKNVAASCQTNVAASEAGDLKSKANLTSDRQLVAAPNREGTESGTEKGGGAPQARPPDAAPVSQIPRGEKASLSDPDSGRAASARRGTSDDAFPQIVATDEGEDYDTLALRALGGDDETPDEPDDFREDSFLFPEEFEALAATSFEGEAWRDPDASAQDRAA